jgi:FkbM family methyltransferase
MVAVATRYGLMEVIDQDSIVSRSLVMYGEWAEQELNLLARFIAPGACVLDAGAFIGTHTLAFSQMVGAGGKVYAFEPRREVFAYLQRNIDLNRAEHVRAFNLALGDQPALLMMGGLDLRETLNFGALALTATMKTATEEQYEIQVVKLDDLEIPPVDLIKLDVEGMESQVLAGAQAIIARDRPVIFAECNALEGGRHLLDFARISGYRVFGSLNDAFHADNFNKVEENIFGTARELSLVLLPSERSEGFQDILDHTQLPEVDSLDDLACLLLGKPQYFGEVLAPYCGTHRIKLAVESPELVELRAANELCNAALSEVKALAFNRLDEISALIDRVTAENAALREAEALAAERLDLIGALQARIELTDAALNEAQTLAISRLKEVLALSSRVAAENAALKKAETLASERLDLIRALQVRIEATETALSEAKTLAFSRQDEISALVTRVADENTALKDAEAIASERLTLIGALQTRIERTDEALSEAQVLGFSRLAEIGSLQGRLEASEAALNCARMEEIPALKARIEQAIKDRQNLEQTKIIRALRATRILKVGI